MSRARPRAAESPPAEAELLIEALGARGDGVAHLAATRVFVAGALPGERVRVALGPASSEGRRGRLVALLEPAAERRVPPCPHFGTCGGCALQHLDEASYAPFKLDLLRRTLQSRGLGGVPLAPLVRVGPGERRRVRLAARRAAPGVALGFRAAGGHAIVPIERCPVATPAIERRLPQVREALPALLGSEQGIELTLTESATGLDLVLHSITADTAERRSALADLAERLDLARLSIAPEGTLGAEIIVTRATPLLRFADVPVAPPPDAFVQPTAAGERALIACVLGAARGLHRAADLFCGLGTFALPLARAGLRVVAIDGAAPAIGALQAAARGAGLADRVEAATADLMRAPLQAAVLDAFDLVVFDPPRAGAAPQAAALARSRVPTVLALSCNPASFARDARLLVDGGYRLERITPLDQFLWSPHLELVGEFRRGRA
jgi:23S rRNA (uracil1939-C5)-methyltransferase